MGKIWQYLKDIRWAMGLSGWRERISYLRLRFAEVFLGWKGFAQGECPNCGHDYTAHSAWIANPGDKTCVTYDPAIEE